MDKNLVKKKAQYQENLTLVALYLYENFKIKDSSLNEKAQQMEECLEKAEKIYQYFGSPKRAIESLEFVKLCSYEIYRSLFEQI